MHARASMPLAVSHESGVGQSRHFTAAQNIRHFGAEADFGFGSRRFAGNASSPRSPVKRGFVNLGRAAAPLRLAFEIGVAEAFITVGQSMEGPMRL